VKTRTHTGQESIAERISRVPTGGVVELTSLSCTHVCVCVLVEVLCVSDRPAVCVEASDSLLTAIRRLRQQHVHRLLVVDSDTGNAVHVLTQRNILDFIASRVGWSYFLTPNIFCTRFKIEIHEINSVHEIHGAK